MEGYRPVTKPLELGKPCVTGACGHVPRAGGRQCLLQVPPRLECCSGESLSQPSVSLECLGGGSEHVGMSPCSPEHQVSCGCVCPKGRDPDSTAVLIIYVNVFGLVFVVTEFPLQD